MDKSIYEKQSDPLIIQCLYAQRSEYTKAKMIAFSYFIICVAGIVIFSILKSCFDNDFVFGLSIGLSVAATCSSSLFEKFEAEHRLLAAELQQYVDTTLYKSKEYQNLNNKWSCSLSTDRVVEIVSKYPKSGFTKDDKWYEDYSKKPFVEQIYYCQKENIRWDGDLRKRYQLICRAFLLIVLIAIFVIALWANPPFLRILSVIAWALPLVKYWISFEKKMKLDLQRIARLVDRVNNIPNMSVILDGEELINKEIELQSLLLEHRKATLLIPNTFYKLFWFKQQKNEEAIADNINQVNDIE